MTTQKITCRIRAIRTALFCVLLAVSAAFADPQDTFDIVEVADGVFAAVERSRMYGVFRSNTTVVIGDDAVLVVDTDGWPSRASSVLKEIERRTDLPVRYIVNTHYGPDHVRGNELYTQRYPGVVIISHESTRREIVENGAVLVQEEIDSRIVERAETAKRQLEAGVDDRGQPLTIRRKRELEAGLANHQLYLTDLKALALRPPGLTFEDHMTLRLGSRLVELSSHRGHSDGDVVVYLPKEKVLIAGDLVVTDRPFSAIVSAHAHREALDTLASLDFRLLVPGHGKLQRDRSTFELARSLVTALVDQVDAAVADGADLERAKELLDFGELRGQYLERQPDLEGVFDLTADRLVATAFEEASATAQELVAPGPFDWTLGRWEGVRRDEASGEESPMLMLVEPILGGAGQSRQIEIPGQGGTYRGHAVQTYDPSLGRWVRQYVNSSRGRFARLEGEANARFSTWRSATPGRSRESRLVSERIGTDGWRRVMAVSEDDGETWLVLWIDELHRANEP